MAEAVDALDVLGAQIRTIGPDVELDPERSRGAYVFDRATKREFLDFSAYSGSRPLGYNHEGLQEPDFLARLSMAAEMGLEAEEVSRFVSRFSAQTLNGSLDSLFFAKDELSAVNYAMHVARRSSANSPVAVFNEGRAANTADGPLRALPLDEGEALAVLKDEDDLAAVVIEPIQSEGGEHFFSTPFLQSLRGLCSDRGTLLIFDEIETGFGSTGAWWDWQHHDVLPDLMCFGGKARIAGVAAVPSLDAVGAPFEGAAVEAVRCDQLLQIIERDGLIGNAETMGRYLLKLLRDLGESHEGIGNLRGQGLCAAMDLPDTQSRDRLVEACFEEQLVVSSSGTRSVRLRAPLDIDADSVARAVAQLEAGIRRAGRAR